MIRFYVGIKYTLRELCLFITTDISERILHVFFLIMCLINDIYVLQELKYTIQSRAKGFNF